MRLLPTIACALLLLAGPTFADQPSSLSSKQRIQLEQILRHSLENHGSWSSIHAAEALIALNQPDGIIKAFAPQVATTQPEYRIGVWRVLARVQTTKQHRDEYTRRIRMVLLDTAAPDRTHAMEALAKLNEPIANEAERKAVNKAATDAGGLKPFALWRLAQEKDPKARNALVTLLRDEDPTTRARAAYILSKLQPLSKEEIQALRRALTDEPSDSPARPAIVVAGGGKDVRQMAAAANSPLARYAAAMHLAEKGTSDDRQLLWNLVKDPDEGVQVAAAFALLRIDRGVPATTVPTGEPKE